MQRHPTIEPNKLTPELLLRAYAAGIFPMAEGRETERIFWVDPEIRGVLPLDDFHMPRRLKRTVRRGVFEIRCDSDFDHVITACAKCAWGRWDTWINREIVGAYTKLFHMGFVHTVESWLDGRMVGGLYGVAMGGVFFGESMFSDVTDASKVALVHLVARLRQGGYVLLDTQFVTDHLRQFGVVEIPAREYLVRLEAAMAADADFSPTVDAAALDEVLGAPTPRTS